MGSSSVEEKTKNGSAEFVNIAFDDDDLSNTEKDTDNKYSCRSDAVVTYSNGKNVNGRNLQSGSKQTNAINFHKGSNNKVENTPNNNEQQSSFSRLRNPVFRGKFFESLFLLWGIVAMGWLYGQMGPTLPDLRLILDASLEEATWLFTGFSIGYMIGCLTAGAIGELISHEGVLGLCSFVCAIAVALLPWLPNVYGMIVVRAVIGICIGGNDTGTHSLVFKLWGSKAGPFLQMIHVVFAVGGVISPLVSKPFMIKVTDNNDVNGTYCFGLNLTNQVTSNNTDNITEAMPQECTTTLETNVHYAFLMTGCIMSSAAIPFLVIFTRECRHVCNKLKDKKKPSDEDENGKGILKLKIFVIVIILIIAYLSTALLDLFPNLLTSFLMSKLNWTQQTSSTLTSMFFAAYAIGNFLNIFSLLFVTSTKVIILCYILGTISLASFTYSVLVDHTILVWVTVITFGLALSAILPTLYTWTQQNVTPMTTRVASALLFAGSVGVMVNPVLMGYLMDNISPMWFVYISFGEAVICFVLFSIILCLVKKNPIIEQPKTNEITVTRL